VSIVDLADPMWCVLHTAVTRNSIRGNQSIYIQAQHRYGNVAMEAFVGMPRYRGHLQLAASTGPGRFLKYISLRITWHVLKFLTQLRNVSSLENPRPTSRARPSLCFLRSFRLLLPPVSAPATLLWSPAMAKAPIDVLS